MKPRIPIPLNDRIVVERAKREEYVGSIALPDTKHDDKTVTGTVLAVGRDVVDVKVLDTIWFSRYNNEYIEVDNVRYLVLREQQVYGVMI